MFCPDSALKKSSKSNNRKKIKTTSQTLIGNYPAILTPQISKRLKSASQPVTAHSTPLWEGAGALSLQPCSGLPPGGHPCRAGA